jgi:hypothetical protein
MVSLMAILILILPAVFKSVIFNASSLAFIFYFLNNSHSE